MEKNSVALSLSSDGQWWIDAYDSKGDLTSIKVRVVHILCKIGIATGKKIHYQNAKVSHRPDSFIAFIEEIR